MAGDDYYSLWSDWNTVCWPAIGMTSCGFSTTSGQHTLQVNGRDPNGNWYSSPTMAMTCDGTPPAPPQFTGISCSGDSASVSWTLIPGDDYYSLWMDWKTVCGPTIGMGSCTFQTVPGSHTLQINGRVPRPPLR